MQHPSSPKRLYVEQMSITRNKFRVISSRIARFLPDLVSKSTRLQPVIKPIVVEVQDNRGCAK